MKLASEGREACPNCGKLRFTPDEWNRYDDLMIDSGLQGRPPPQDGNPYNLGCLCNDGGAFDQAPV